jgi:hypothetical protein
LNRQSQHSLQRQEPLSGDDPWYVLRNDQTFGPLSFGDLAQFAQQQRLQEDDWVWKPGLASWIAAGDVSGLFDDPLRGGTAPSDQSAAGESEEPEHRRNVKEKAKHQIKEFVLMFLYLWVVFGMLAAHESIVLAQHHIDFQLHGIAFINALIFAKVMLVAEDLHLGRRLNDKPLVYSVAFKSITFAMALICFHIVEHVVIGILHGRTIAEVLTEIGVDNLAGIVSVGIIATVALVPFFILREISRVIGADIFWALFFRRRNP